LVVGSDRGDTAEVSVFDAVAVSFECDHFGVMDEAIDHGCGDDVVADDAGRPITFEDRAVVRRDQIRCA
jgi:hypothetical protein